MRNADVISFSVKKKHTLFFFLFLCDVECGISWKVGYKNNNNNNNKTLNRTNVEKV